MSLVRLYLRLLGNYIDLGYGQFSRKAQVDWKKVIVDSDEVSWRKIYCLRMLWFDSIFMNRRLVSVVILTEVL